MRTSDTAHLGDGELLQLADRSASNWELDLWSSHVIGCQECSVRLADRQETAQAVTAAVRTIQLPSDFRTASETMAAARQRRKVGSRSNTWNAARATAAILILLLPVLFVAPVRAAVVDWLRQGWEAITGGGTPSDGQFAGGTPEPEASVASYTVSFEPSGGVLLIRLASDQAGGTISVSATNGSDASVLVESSGSESAVVTNGGLSIVNQPESTASYSITVPQSVRTVRIERGALPPVELSQEEVASGWRQELSGR